MISLPDPTAARKKRLPIAGPSNAGPISDFGQQASQQVGEVADQMADTGQPTAPVFVTTEGVSDTLDPNAEAPTDQGLTTQHDLDTLYEDYAESTFAPTDTTAEEAQLQAQSDRLMGQNLVDQRASMGRGGFAASGAMAALENTARSDAARQLGLDVSGIRDREDQQRRGAIEGAMGIDTDKQRLSYEQMLAEAKADAIRSMMDEQPDAPPEEPPTEIKPPTEAAGNIAIDLANEEDPNRFNDEEEAAIRSGTSDPGRTFIDSITTGPEYLYILATEGQEAADAFLQEKYDGYVERGGG